MSRRNWTRTETLVAFNLYCRTPFGRLHARNPEIIEVASTLDRTPSALAMKCCNLAALDSALQSRGISGLRKTSQLDEEIWKEFTRDPESLTFESERAYAELMQKDVRASETVEWEHVQGLEAEVITRVRVNQHFFRSIILAGYQSKCAVCALPITSLLVASHIVPWSIDKTIRMNPQNGLCLCSIHDRAFDSGLLIIGCDYKIEFHPNVSAVAKVDCVKTYFLQFAGKTIHLPDRWPPDPVLLKRQRQLILARSNEGSL
jgi:putative restriction endonuclease